MDLAKIQEMWKKDSVIDDVMLDKASLAIPQLHQKYLAILSNYKLLQKKKYHELKKLKHHKTLWYGGKLPAEEYDAPFQYKVMKGDIPGWVEIDEQVQKVELQLELYNETIDTLNEIIKQIHQMSYNIKNAIQWRTFTNGI